MTSSPVSFLAWHLRSAVVNIAPERIGELNKKHGDAHLLLDYINSDDWILDVDVDAKHIRVSSFVLEFFWATGYAHFRFFNLIRTGAIESGKHYDAASVGIADEMSLLCWVVDKYVNKTKVPWPEHLPKPFIGAPKDSDFAVADEMALGSVSCLIHHEIAHIEMLHSGKSQIDRERDADNYAIDRILGAIDHDSVAGKKRLLCLAHAYFSTLAMEIITGKVGGVTHPRGVDRINSAVSRYELDENHLVYAFMAAVVHLYTQNTARPLLTTRECDSFRQSFEDSLNHISGFPSMA